MKTQKTLSQKEQHILRWQVTAKTCLRRWGEVGKKAAHVYTAAHFTFMSNCFVTDAQVLSDIDSNLCAAPETCDSWVCHDAGLFFAKEFVS